MMNEFHCAICGAAYRFPFEMWDRILAYHAKTCTGTKEVNE